MAAGSVGLMRLPDFPAASPAATAAAEAAYRAHVACASALRHAVQLGHAVSEVLARRRAPPGLKPAFKRALARQPPFLTGAARLRHALDCVLCVDVDRRQEHALRHDPGLPRVVEVYFGWDARAATARRRPLRPGDVEPPRVDLRMADLAQVRVFAAAMRAALALVLDLWRVTGLDASDARLQLLDLLAARHVRALAALEDRVRHAAAAHIQAAWRRAWYRPGMGVWRRRMLREFQDLTAAENS